MSRWKLALRALLPFALHGLAREIDAATGVLLRSSLELPAFVRSALGLLEPAAVAVTVAAWTLGGAAIWVVLGRWRFRREAPNLEGALAVAARAFTPLYLRPALTLVALVSLAVRPSFPYGFTLGVALTQDWAIAQDAAAAAALVALWAPALRLPAPRAGAVFFVAFLVYALLTPARARDWDQHPGNEPKYLRMAVAIGHDLTPNAEGVSAAMEELPTKPLLSAAADAAGTLWRESLRMGGTLLGGPGAVGASAIEATRITRQTIRGKEGGVFYVLAPGPSILLAPTLRLDRAINRARGVEGRLAVSVLAWNALAAALVALLYVLARDATGRPGLAAAVAFGFALVPPFLFYFFQFWPEMAGALGLGLATRWILIAPRWSVGRASALGLLLAALPWLHQKFLPVWGALALMAVVVARRRGASGRALLAVVAPQALTVYLTALYNFAITGSVRPDALFLAWGPGGVSTSRMGQGLLGLWLDARYGILPYAPVFLLGFAGIALVGGGRVPRLRLALVPAAAYYFTVASADNWSGAVCNLGRYIMPVLPVLVAFVAVALDRTASRRGALALVLILVAWTALFARALWLDPIAANDSGLLLARSAFADGGVYIPNLFLKRWGDGAPGLVPRTFAWLLLGALLVAWLRRAAAGRAGSSPARTLAAVFAMLLAVGLGLERWPSARTGPRFHDGIVLGPEAMAFFSGAVTIEAGDAVAREGPVEALVRSRKRLGSIALVAGGDGLLEVPGHAPIVVRPAGARVVVPLETLVTLHDREGREETLARQRFSVRGAVLLRPVPESGEQGGGGPRS